MRKKIYNPNSDEVTHKVVGGSPDGIANFMKPSRKVYKQVFDTMLNNYWNPATIDLTEDAKRVKTLDENKYRMYELTFAKLIYNDSVITNRLMDDINPFITDPIVNACIALQSGQEATHCYAEGTEVLTSEGFIDFKDLTFNHKVANYCEDGTIFFDYPKDIIKSKYAGDMYRFHMRNYEQLVTPNHRIVMRYPHYHKSNLKGKIRIQEAKDAFVGAHSLPVAGYGIGSKINLTPIERIAIAFQADGSYMNKEWCERKGFDVKEYKTQNGYSYRFAFKRKDKITRFQKLVDDAGINYTRTETQNKYVYFYINSEFKMDKNFNWVNLEEISSSYCEEFIDELKYWDGCIRKNDSVLYSNTNKKAINKIIEIATLCGYQTGLYTVYNENDKQRVPCFQVHIVKNKDHKTGREVKKEVIKDYNGMIYCATVETGMLVCRYKDSVFVSGNSLSYAYIGDDVLKSDKVYHLFKEDQEIKIVAEHLNTQYEYLLEPIRQRDSNKSKALLAIANLCLEGISFPAGFVTIWSIGDEMPGSASMITEISRDELQTHLPLYANIYKHIKEDCYLSGDIDDIAYKMIVATAEIEKKFMKYATKNVLGFSSESIDEFFDWIISNRLRELGIKNDIQVNKENGLVKVFKKYATYNETKSNFFESSVKTYSKQGLDWDF